MEIGYLRMNQKIELDYMEASPRVGGCEVRLGLLEAWVDEGHDVTILSPIDDDDKHLLDEEDQTTFGEFGGGETDPDEEIDYDFLKEVEYDPLTRDPDVDVLFVECGPTNATYAYSGPFPPEYGNTFGDSVPYLWRTFDLVDNYEGHVVYYQHDRHLPFPFAICDMEPTENADSVRNLSRMGQNVEFHDNKEWTVLTTGLNPNALEDLYTDRVRYEYDKYPLSYTTVPTAWSRNIDQEFDPVPIDETEHDLLYVGIGDRKAYRRKKVEKFYDHPDLRSTVIGSGWLPCNGTDNRVGDHINYLGQVGTHGEAYKLYNRSLTGIQVGDEELETLQSMTGRIHNIVLGGAVALVDSDLATGFYVDEDYQISTRDEAREMVEWVRDLSVEDRKKIQEEQKERLPRYKEIDWENTVLTHQDGHTVADPKGSL